VSYAGATSTISAETMRRPSRPLRMVRSSLVDHPPVSGVPVAGAKAGSRESIYVYLISIRVTKVTATNLTSIDKYTGPSPTVSRIFLIIPSVPEGSDGHNYHEVRLLDYLPRVSISRASIRLKPMLSSLS
jgi:hypothetical protein